MNNDGDDDDERPPKRLSKSDGRESNEGSSGTGGTKTGFPDDEHTPNLNIEHSEHDDGAQIESPPSPARKPQSPRSISPPLPSTSTSTSPSENKVSMRTLTDSFTPLLRCPACSPPSRLVSPTTLHCGHTVCAKHVRTEFSTPSSSSAAHASTSTAHPTPADLSPVPESSTHRQTSRPRLSPAPPTPPQLLTVPTCPLPTCQPRVRQQVITPNIPLDSAVAYYPPIAQPAPTNADPIRVTVPDPRLDVSIGRVLYLLDKARRWEEEDERIGERSASHSDGTDDEGQESDEHEVNDSQSSMPNVRHDRRRHRPAQGARKRTRRDEHSDGRHHRHQHASRDELEERFNKELTESLTCEICFTLLYQPVTTPCQHTFCAKCLQRSLDHGSKCPLCRQDLPTFSYFQDHPFNKVILAILLKALPDGYAERGRVIEEEERDGRLNTPIFVCQLSFPGIPTLLHFYEPRYRLMLRRCLESPTPCFGMIMPQRTVGAGSSDYGTMLEIRSVQMLPDGRSIVETMGTHRFRIMETGTLDGYMVGRIERVDDIPTELEEEAEQSIASLLSSRAESSEQSSSIRPGSMPPPTTDELIAICHAFVESLRNGTAPWVVQRLNNTYGPMPSDVSSFSFWIAQVLPIEEHEKAKLLVIKSARARLRLVVYWIEQLNSNWWFSEGCTIS